MATSSIRITKICQWCGVEFEAQKVSTKYCSHRCANLAYKQAVRDKRVKQAEAKTLSIKLEKPIENVRDKEYLSFAQAGKLLGLSRQAVYNMVKAGNLKASKISSRLSFIKRTDIDAMLENKPYKTLHPKDSVPITDFYTTAEVKEKFQIQESWLYKIAKEHNIPRTFNRGKTYWSKKLVKFWLIYFGVFTNFDASDVVILHIVIELVSREVEFLHSFGYGVVLRFLRLGKSLGNVEMFL